MKSKDMKRIMIMFSAALLSLSLYSGLAYASAEEQDAEYLVTAEALEEKLCELMGDDVYLSFLSTPNMKETISAWGNDWLTDENRQQAVVCSVDSADLTAAIDEGIRLFIPDGMTETGKDQLRMRVFASLPSYMNTGSGSDVLVASSLLTISDRVSMDAVNGQYAFVLEDFGDDHPMVYTSFVIDENGIGSASSVLVMHSEITDAIFTMTGSDISKMIEEEAGVKLPESMIGYLNGIHVAVY